MLTSQVGFQKQCRSAKHRLWAAACEEREVARAELERELEDQEFIYGVKADYRFLGLDGHRRPEPLTLLLKPPVGLFGHGHRRPEPCGAVD